MTDGTTGAGPPGRVTDNTGPTGMLSLTYTSPEASGITDFTLTGVAVVNGVTVNFGPDRFTIGVQIDGLGFITTTGLAVASASNMHDNFNGYADTTAMTALDAMAQTFANILTSLNKTVPPVRVTVLVMVMILILVYGNSLIFSANP